MNHEMGWVRDDDAVAALLGELPEPNWMVTQAGEDTADPPDHVYLWDVARKVTGSLLRPWSQGQVGSCVSFGTARAIEYSMCCEIAAGEPEEFRSLCQEAIYGGSRVEVGGGKLRGDGSTGSWAAEWVRKWGLIDRGVHGSYDLSEYSVDRCKKWGAAGVPDDLEPLARKHPVSVTQVTSWGGAMRMLANGYGIAICSSQGFSMARDTNGICQPSGSWAHCMCLCGYATINGAVYGRIDNSWGPSSHTGPVGPGDPGPEGFYASGATIDKMLRQGDSWAFSAVQGFPSRRINWVI
jgi:hypothetical protein